MNEQIEAWLDAVRSELDLVELSDESIGMIVCGAFILWLFMALLRRGRRKGKSVRGGWSLSQPLVAWSQHEALTIGTSFEGIFCCGATGSGKTSGSGRTLAEAMLRAGYGALVCTMKPDETALWRAYAQRTGRLKDLVIFGPGHGYNFLREVSDNSQPGRGYVENVADILANACEVADRSNSKSDGRDDSAFWKNAQRQATRNAVVALKVAHGSVTVPDLFEFVTSSPTTTAEGSSKRWQTGSFCHHTLSLAEKRCQPHEEEDVRLSIDYFMRQLPSVGEKTRGNIVMTLIGMADILNHGIARETLCNRTTVRPQDARNGKVIVLDFPIGQDGITGRLIQGIFRYCAQQEMLRTDMSRPQRPVVFWIDECQNFLGSHDMYFTSTCRSFRVAHVLMSQNLSNIYAALGGIQKGKAEADSILANLNLKIMHANGCPVTNGWTSASIGHTRQMYFNGSSSPQSGDWVSSMCGLGGGPTMSSGFQEQMDFEVQPSEFTRLRTGGPRNNWEVDGIVFQSGRVFSDTGKTWRRVTFKQKP